MALKRGGIKTNQFEHTRLEQERLSEGDWLPLRVQRAFSRTLSAELS
jgi:hypothetical protein